MAAADNKNNVAARSVTRNGVVANETNGFGIRFGACE